MEAPKPRVPGAVTGGRGRDEGVAPVRGNSPGGIQGSSIAPPVYESVLQEVERRTKEVCERDPEANPDAVRPHVEMLVKNERRRRAAEQAEGAAREESPDYDTGSQEVRRGRRR